MLRIQQFLAKKGLVEISHGHQSGVEVYESSRKEFPLWSSSDFAFSACFSSSGELMACRRRYSTLYSYNAEKGVVMESVKVPIYLDFMQILQDDKDILIFKRGTPDVKDNAEQMHLNSNNSISMRKLIVTLRKRIFI